jgi:L-ascorbate metabolism protein UlaG (beta-lactamase superfamily)
VECTLQYGVPQSGFIALHDDIEKGGKPVKIQLLRHATLFLEIGAASYVVDPMFSPAEAWDPIRNSPNQRRNPLVDLPMQLDELEDAIDALAAAFVTHIHMDHWDGPAKEQLSKDLPVFCQPNDQDTIKEAGFSEVIVAETGLEWEGLNISLTGGRHGTGEVAERIGPVSGFVIKSMSEPSLYLAGDTVWCPEVESALEAHQPEVVVVNAGAAQFVDSDPITMDIEDVMKVAQALPESRVVAVHMESINHCLLTRADLARALDEAGLSARILIPANGETLTF